MPLLNRTRTPKVQSANHSDSSGELRNTNAHLLLKREQLGSVARIAMMNQFPSIHSDTVRCENGLGSAQDNKLQPSKALGDNLRAPQQKLHQSSGHGAALTDTPLSTAPNSPRIPPRPQELGAHTPSSRSRPTTLDIPGLTRSKVSPDGRIAQRDVGAKLVIVMVGLPARGKSYITKKISRYLNWLQHDTKIFNVGERRRVAAGISQSGADPKIASWNQQCETRPNPCHRNQLCKIKPRHKSLTVPASFTDRIIHERTPLRDNGSASSLPPPQVLISQPLESHSWPPSAENDLRDSLSKISGSSGVKSSLLAEEFHNLNGMDQSASFFDPDNAKAVHLREELALATLDELLDYILDQGGSVGIFDATNSTLERRKLIIQRVRERAGPELGVLFLESLCIDENLLESNMRLKLSGPDYKDQDPIAALDDFKKRVALYEQKYVPLGTYEERNNIPYVQMIDVGRKVVSHQIKGFLSAQTVYYLLNFNLSPRQIWITRHGESLDNINGKIGGDSDLSGKGFLYAKALTRFIKHKRDAWEIRQQNRAQSTHFPPLPGDTTPPNPEYTQYCDDDGNDKNYAKNFCVWTSMLKRSIQTAQYFDDESFEIKQMKMLDELNAGMMEGLTYDEIKTHHWVEYELRKHDKMHYRYPGAGGEGYLDIINRLRAVIVEVERMTDHVLLVGHRSVARVLLAYFKGLKREEVADLDVPLGMLYMLEPKPYGVDFQAYRYNEATDWFDHVPDYQLRPDDSYGAF